MLREEVPVGEVVRLEFELPLGRVEVLALVRQRSAFRYGFQFVEDQFRAGRHRAHLQPTGDGSSRDATSHPSKICTFPASCYPSGTSSASNGLELTS